jgi:putative flavoprotein involved in K+ transport
MDLDIWGGAECLGADFDESRDEWAVKVQRGGRTLVLHPKQLVFATGINDRPHVPAFPGAEVFPGEQFHSDKCPIGSQHKGRRCVVIGADVSAHDIAAALWEVGADVTMVQRSPTIVMRREALLHGFNELYSDAAVERGMTLQRADLAFASIPFRVLEAQQKTAYAEVKRQDADFYERLANAGFWLSDGEDGSGLLPHIFRRGAGYYVDIGASTLIANGSIKIRSRVGVEAITKNGLLLSDGSELPADVIVYATGYERSIKGIRRILPKRIADKVGKIYGYGSGVRGDPCPWEGELRNLFKPTQQKSLWFHIGGFITSRFYSRTLALQIKAREIGLPTPTYELAKVHHHD